MKEYFKFLTDISNSYHKRKEPLSLVMLSHMLSSHFNLSPEYCDKAVEKWVNRKEEK